MARLICLLVLIAASHGVAPLPTDGELTDQSRLDQIDELNQYISTYLQTLKFEVTAYQHLGLDKEDKELNQQLDSVRVILQLITHSWLHYFKPEERYYPLGKSSKKAMEEQEKILSKTIKTMDQKLPVGDAILTYTDMESLRHLEIRKNRVENIIVAVDAEILKCKESKYFEEAERIGKWKKRLQRRLMKAKEALKFSGMIREMFLQSYISNFGVKHDGLTIEIKHSLYKENKMRAFPTTQEDTLSVLEEINKQYYKK